MPVLSCRSRFSCRTTLLFVISFVTLCIYQLHHPQPRSISLSITLAHFDHLSDGQPFSQSPSSNCVHYKVYFILHFIMYTFYFYFFFLPTCWWSWLNPPTSLRIFFWFFLNSRTYNHPLCPSIPSALVYLHSLSFFSLTHLLLVLPCHIVPFNPIRLSPDIKSARSSIDLSRTRMRFRFCILTCAGRQTDLDCGAKNM